ncbi:unnamed protein product [Closterium sp. Naga37s-1]|nr:unnamed protein product [Closterium sp. Naga37s-1]
MSFPRPSLNLLPSLSHRPSFPSLPPPNPASSFPLSNINFLWLSYFPPSFYFPIPLFTLSDINLVWLRDPRRYFPPSHSLMLPSLSHQVPPQQQHQQLDAPPAQGAAESRQQAAAPAPPNTTALTPALLGSLSPWLMALRPSSAVQAMVHHWAVGALRGYVTAVEEDGLGGGSEGGTEAGVGEVSKAGQEEGTEAGMGGGMGDAGEGKRGASVGVLPEQLFPPGWRAVGDRAWLEAHRKEIVALQVSCREDGRQQEVCLRDMKLWL